MRCRGRGEAGLSLVQLYHRATSWPERQAERWGFGLPQGSLWILPGSPGGSFQLQAGCNWGWGGVYQLFLNAVCKPAWDGPEEATLMRREDGAGISQGAHTHTKHPHPHLEHRQTAAARVRQAGGNTMMLATVEKRLKNLKPRASWATVIKTAPIRETESTVSNPGTPHGLPSPVRSGPSETGVNPEHCQK